MNIPCVHGMDVGPRGATFLPPIEQIPLGRKQRVVGGQETLDPIVWLGIFDETGLAVMGNGLSDAQAGSEFEDLEVADGRIGADDFVGRGGMIAVQELQMQSGLGLDQESIGAKGAGRKLEGMGGLGLRFAGRHGQKEENQRNKNERECFFKTPVLDERAESGGLEFV